MGKQQTKQENFIAVDNLGTTLSVTDKLGKFFVTDYLGNDFLEAYNLGIDKIK